MVRAPRPAGTVARWVGSRRGRPERCGPCGAGAPVRRRARLPSPSAGPPGILPVARHSAVALAQWQSSGLWIRRLRVRAPQATPTPRPDVGDARVARWTMRRGAGPGLAPGASMRRPTRLPSYGARPRRFGGWMHGLAMARWGGGTAHGDRDVRSRQQEVRRRPRRQRPEPRDRRRRVHGPGRTIGLRQDHQPADDRRARGDHRAAPCGSATASSTTSRPRIATSRWSSRATRSTRT